jgi:hypothetical protein
MWQLRIAFQIDSRRIPSRISDGLRGGDSLEVLYLAIDRWVDLAAVATCRLRRSVGCRRRPGAGAASRSGAFVTGLTLALGMAAAASATTQGQSVRGSHGGQGNASHKTHPATTKVTMRSSSFRVIYIDIPAVPPPAPYVDPNQCEDSGTSCTDQQLCEYWGECDSTSVAATADPTATDPSPTD